MAYFSGTNGNDILSGTDAPDTIEGGDGNDVIDGRGGADVMRGGRGDDVFHVDDPGDQVEELSNQGTDEVRSTISYVLGPNVENLVLLGTAPIDGTGNSLNNRITGNDAANVFRGGGGSDIFVGGGGDDVYFIEADVTVSKRGGYTFSGIDQVIEAAGGGVDTIYSNASLALPADVENIFLTGSLDLYAFGNALDNFIAGNNGRNFLHGHGGNDYISGGAGADHMDGGAGNDTFVVDDALDFVQETFDGGTDRVISSISYQLLNSELEHLALTGPAAINGIGNFRDNDIIGNDAANVLRGEAGNDNLIGRGGDDNLGGGMGDDLMVGGLGDDIYHVDNANDVVVENEGEGRDMLFTAGSYALREFEQVELLLGAEREGTGAINLQGNSLDNIIQANAGDNVLRGHAGNDVLAGFEGNDNLDGGVGADNLTGGLGDDIYHIDTIDDVIVEHAGEGRDMLFVAGTYILRESESIEVILAAERGTTDAIDITGNSQDNIIHGNDGVNILDGRGGNDVLAGFDGADSFVFSSALDAAANVDTVIGFEAGVDNLRLDDAVFTGLARGVLDLGAFVVGSEAAEADDRIIYDPTTGALSFDADGAGGAEAVQFAFLEMGLTNLSANDFLVM